MCLQTCPRASVWHFINNSNPSTGRKCVQCGICAGRELAERCQFSNVSSALQDYHRTRHSNLQILSEKRFFLFPQQIKIDDEAGKKKVLAASLSASVWQDVVTWATRSMKQPRPLTSRDESWKNEGMSETAGWIGPEILIGNEMKRCLWRTRVDVLKWPPVSVHSFQLAAMPRTDDVLIPTIQNKSLFLFFPISITSWSSHKRKKNKRKKKTQQGWE